MQVAIVLSKSCFLSKKDVYVDIFKLISPMGIRCICSDMVILFNDSITNTVTWFCSVVCAVATFRLFKQPWIFPITIVLGGLTTNLSRKRIPQVERKPRKIKWWNFWLFGIIFITAGLFSEVARKNDWPIRAQINFFENTFWMGSLFFVGGQF